MQLTSSLVVLASFLAATNALVAVPRDVDSLEARDVEIEARDAVLETRKGGKPRPNHNNNNNNNHNNNNNNNNNNHNNNVVEGCSVTSCILAIANSGVAIGDCQGLAENPTALTDALVCISSVASAGLDTREQCRGCSSVANRKKNESHRKFKNGKPCSGKHC